MYGLPWMPIFCHEWGDSATIWKSSSNRLTRDKASVFTETRILFYFLHAILVATKPLYEWFVLAVCPSVTPFFHYVPIMVSSWNCQEFLPMTEVTSMQNGKARGQSSMSQTVTQDWIHIWWWNAAQSLMLLPRRELWFFKGIRKISRSHGYKIVDFAQIGCFRTVTPDWIHQWLLNDAQRLK